MSITPGPWKLERCPCDHSSCHRYGLSNGMFYQGNGFSLDDATAITEVPAMLALLHDIAKADEESIVALAEMGIPVSDQSHVMAERINALIAKAEGR